MTRLARQTIASIHNRKRPEGEERGRRDDRLHAARSFGGRWHACGERREGVVMSACMPNARLEGDGMPVGEERGRRYERLYAECSF